jgi:hypothetical protein
MGLSLYITLLYHLIVSPHSITADFTKQFDTLSGLA